MLENADELTKDEKVRNKVVKRKSFEMKPMDEEEAILEFLSL